MLSPSHEAIAAALKGEYVVERELGSGGMATVLLARDVRHDRMVAIKLLREDLSMTMGTERFLREIRTTASLQHPHIVPLFDSGEVDGTVYFVMPYVDGESLRDRLRRERQLSVADAVRIAREVADALDYAHRKGFIHRDVKPENILLHDGRAMVADFGVALALSRVESDTRITDSGLAIGTPQYMSPEQALGERQVTARADIFALGAILYEMLAGEAPFAGPTAQAIVARIMTSTPTPIRDMRPTVPAHVAAAIEGAMQKLAADRFQTAAAFSAALAAGPTETAAGASAARVAPARRLSLGMASAVGAALVLAALGGAWVARRMAPSPSVALGVARAVIPLGQGQLIATTGRPLDLSHDGTMLTYVATEGGKTLLFVRGLADTVSRRLTGTDGASTPFFSPDGRWIAFFADGQLKKIPVSGGTPVVIASDAKAPFGGSWGRDETILFSFGDSLLHRVDSKGGRVRDIVVRMGKGANGSMQRSLWWPSFLPGNDRALVAGDSGIGIVTLSTGSFELITRGRQAQYVPNGKLVYDDGDGRMRVASVDIERAKLTGTPIPVFEAFRGPASSATFFVVGDNGTLLYMPGGFQRTLVRVDRNGRETPIGVEPRGYRMPSVSPDGKLIAVTVDPRPSSIWLIDPARSQASPLTMTKQHLYSPIWSPDGSRLAFVSGGGQVSWTTTEQGAPIRPVLDSASVSRRNLVSPSAWLRNDEFVGYATNARHWQSRANLVHYTFGDSTVTPIAVSTADERTGGVSPDGEWVVYMSNASGAAEVYVRSLNRPGGGIPVSTGGGDDPAWSPRGGEVFYRNGTKIMAVPVRTSPSFAVLGKPQELFSGEFDFSQRTNWSPSVDGSFVMVKADPSFGRQLRVVFNWFAEVEKMGKE